MITGRCGHQLWRECSVSFRQPDDRVCRATDLVGERRLQGFELEIDVNTADARQPFGAAERGPKDAAADALSRLTDVVDGGQDRFAPST